MTDQAYHDQPRQDDPPDPAAQPPLFEVTARGSYAPRIGAVGALGPGSPLPVARYWYRRFLEQSQHPRNTVESYLYDLSFLERTVGPKPIDEVTSRDVAHYLGESHNPSTRKRRLTSVSGLFKWLIHTVKLIEHDPTESFYPDHIPLKTPRPLFEAEQQAMLDAAVADSPRSGLIVWLMLRLGLSRGEVLQLRRDYIDFGDRDEPLVYVFYDNPRWRGKERKLAASPELEPLFLAFESEFRPGDVLFEMLPQSVNKMTERVARAAGISKRVTPQTLRDTYAVERARDGADDGHLLALLGLADDPRNRMSVRRYIKLAAPPVNN
ncbi:MAG TPA: site-specific integrase [Thermomicrobiales bacterium]|nr:site-specific integrase [Thermomicrobiales bacterium]